MALANLSAAISLDDMLSGLEKSGPASVVFDGGEGSEHGGRAPSSRGMSMSRRSLGRTSVLTRGSFTSFGTRVQSVMDGSIRHQAGMEAKSYGNQHPSGAASESARRARATADAVRDAASRVAAFKSRSMSNPYVDSLTPRENRWREYNPDSYTPRSTGSRDGGRTPRSGTSSRVSSPESRGGESHAESVMTARSHLSSASARQPRSTTLGAVFCSPKSERTVYLPRSEFDPRRIALGPWSTIDGQRDRQRDRQMRLRREAAERRKLEA